MYALKPIPATALASALIKAERYRLLNQGAIAESICDDVLAHDGTHQPALVMKILAITDQFQEDGIGHHATRALELVGRLSSGYARAYYEGIIHERRGRAHLTQRRGPGAGVLAHGSFESALACFARAIDAGLADEAEAEAVLRWNACVRTLERHPELRAHRPEPEAVIESE
ncbi:MAG: hypothetical protein H0V80_10035 [Acidobacteria bacterium]|nr:hypothetical protein [Acidobacteriota bacterium]